MMRRIDGHRDGAFHRTENCKTSANAQQSALVQSCLFEANSFKPVMKNQWLASPNFPDLCTLHQSPRNSIASESLAAADFPPFRPPKKWDFRQGLAAAVKGSLLQELADTSLRLEKPATSSWSELLGSYRDR